MTLGETKLANDLGREDTLAHTVGTEQVEELAVDKKAKATQNL